MLGVLAFQRVHLLGQLDADALLHGHVFVVGVILHHAALHGRSQCLVVAGSSAVLLAQSVQDTPHRPLLVQDAVVGFLGGLHDHLAKLPVVLAPHQLAKRFPVCLRVGAAFVCGTVLFLAFSSIFLRVRLFRRAQHLIHLSGSSLPALALGGGRHSLFFRRSFAGAFCCAVSALRKQLQFHGRFVHIICAAVCDHQLNIVRIRFRQRTQALFHKVKPACDHQSVRAGFRQSLHHKSLAMLHTARQQPSAPCSSFYLVCQRLRQHRNRRTHDVLPRRGVACMTACSQTVAFVRIHHLNFDHVTLHSFSNRRNEKKAFSEAASFFPFRHLLWGLKGASSPFPVPPAPRK